MIIPKDWISFTELMERWDTKEEQVIVDRMKKYKGDDVEDDVEGGGYLQAYEKGYYDPPAANPGYNATWISDKCGPEREPYYYMGKAINEKTLTFYIKDVESYEESHGIDSTPLDGKERTELGRLKNEKKTWDSSLEAAFYLGVVNNVNERIKRQELKTIYREKFPDQKAYPDTTFDRIWKKVPESMKFTGGKH
ncbi:hypothetical protein Dalk_4785 [Desulfatibacillum aliphaticivorans]|uniref:Uncharacterized protein n=1 Tax=Desulfatibacillum aliphaticivorans TaxID=218208 RepID=B8FD31_DESAL|nr:hypothetical protein [Desulfatibacillum aliphaticivorans]ACL06462.1 hypothetical protein Dalk_4785 [Desulfatibacillum aliphaticivorans]